MGTLGGHLLAGMFFLAYSFYYSVLVSMALLQEQRSLKLPLPPREKRGQKWWQLVPLEGMMKVVFTTAGIILEFFCSPGVNQLMMVDWKDPQRPFVFKDSWQHVTMYGFFLLSGVVDIVSQACQARQKMKLERAAEALAFYTLVLLMADHLQNKSALEIRAHILFLVPCFFVALVLTIEVWVPDQPSLWVLRTWMALVLSNWMLQLAVVLYAPPSGQPWRADSSVDLAFLTIFFCWHLAFGAAVLATIYALCSLWHRHCSSHRNVLHTRYQLCPTDPGNEELQKLRAETRLQDGGI